MHYSKYFHRDSFFFDMWNFGELFAKKNKRQDDALDAFTKIGSLSLSNSSLRKQPTFRDATPGFPLKWRLRNELTNSILMTRHYLHPFGWKLASTNQQHYSHLRSDASSIWKFCSRFSDVISWGKKWWRHEISAVFSGYSNSSQNSAPYLNKQNTRIGKMQNPENETQHIVLAFTLPIRFYFRRYACVCYISILPGADPGKLYQYYLFSSCLPRNTFYLGNLSDMHMAEQMTRSLDKTC